jgi:PKD repeat protein
MAFGPNNQVDVNFTGWGTLFSTVQSFSTTVQVGLDINPSATAAFTASVNVATATFTNTSSGANSYFWDFGDGNTSSAFSPTHTFSGPGNYIVCLIADNGSCPDTTCQQVTAGCPAPTAGFTTAPNNLTVAFTDATLGSPSTWFWDFGDGNSSTLQSPTHTYAVPGPYTVCLTVVDSCGADSSCQSINVVCPIPVASFTTSANQLTVTLTNTSTSTGGNTVYLWDFGDGNTALTQNASHTYALPGTYTICHLISDDCGTDSFCDSIIVSCPAPAVAFSYAANLLLVNFTNGTTNSGGNVSYLWDFDDGNTATSQNAQHTYAMAGTYTVCLTVTDDCGSDSSCQNLNVVAIGIPEPGLLAGLQAFPNPNAGDFILEGELRADLPLEVRVTDVVGKVIFREELSTGFGEFRRRIALTHPASGLYFVQVQAGREVHTLKIQVQ